MKIGIVNNRLGNIGSVQSALSFYKYDLVLVQNPDELDNVDLIVLAGVGNFSAGVGTLKKLGFWSKLNDLVLVKKRPVLGICLGMQFFANVSFENGKTPGFGWIKGQVVRIDEKKARVPHMGWNKVESTDKRIFKGILHNYFYFMHSYHFIPENPQSTLATTLHGGERIVSAVRKHNILGFQFHPEKSQGDGLRLLRNSIDYLLC